MTRPALIVSLAPAQRHLPAPGDGRGLSPFLGPGHTELPGHGCMRAENPRAFTHSAAPLGDRRLVVAHVTPQDYIMMRASPRPASHDVPTLRTLNVWRRLQGHVHDRTHLDEPREANSALVKLLVPFDFALQAGRSHSQRRGSVNKLLDRGPGCVPCQCYQCSVDDATLCRGHMNATSDLREGPRQSNTLQRVLHTRLCTKGPKVLLQISCPWHFAKESSYSALVTTQLRSKSGRSDSNIAMLLQRLRPP